MEGRKEGEIGRGGRQRRKEIDMEGGRKERRDGRRKEGQQKMIC